MSTKNVEIQDSAGNVYYPHTDADIVKYGDSTVGASLSDMKQEQDKFTEDTNGKLLYNGNKVGATTASELAVADTSALFTSNPKNVENVLKEVFTNASNGKSSLVSFITGKGGTANANMTWAQLIAAMSGLKMCASGIATPHIINYGSIYDGIGVSLNLSFVPTFICMIGTCSLNHSTSVYSNVKFGGIYINDGIPGQSANLVGYYGGDTLTGNGGITGTITMDKVFEFYAPTTLSRDYFTVGTGSARWFAML